MSKELTAEAVAKEFHELYERLAPEFDYETRQETRIPWDELPQNMKDLMVAVARGVLVYVKENSK